MDERASPTGLIGQRWQKDAAPEGKDSITKPSAWPEGFLFCGRAKRAPDSLTSRAGGFVRIAAPGVPPLHLSADQRTIRVSGVPLVVQPRIPGHIPGRLLRPTRPPNRPPARGLRTGRSAVRVPMPPGAE